MKRIAQLNILALLVGLAAPMVHAEDDGYTSLFDGKTLKNWDGNPKFWRVEEGAITGQTTAENPTKGNTFIIWRGGELGDFELKLEYKIINGNSGIQYRSFEVEDNKWVIGGYQGDFEAGDKFSGILYGERFRGILANRGDKTVIGDNHKPKVVGSVGDSKEIQTKIKKEDWNEYHITAKGFDFTHRINGVVTCQCTDEDAEKRRSTGILALQLHQGPPMKVQFRNIRVKRLDGQATPANESEACGPGAAGPEADEKKNDLANDKAKRDKAKRIVFVAGNPSHGYGSHEHYAGCVLLAKSLQAVPGLQIEVVQNGWPKDESVFADADAVVMYADGGGRHPVIPHSEAMDKMADAGMGIVCLHYGVEVPKGEPGDYFLKWIGGYFEPNWSVNPHWTAKFESFPDHPTTRGVKPFEINDEWYYHMRFRENMEGVTPILTDLPGPDTLKRPDGAHSGNPHVRAAVLDRKEPQHVAWASERPNGGRGFGFTGGHNHWNWGDPNFRKLVLNAIVWAAHGDVPKNGIGDKPVSFEELEKNQDYKQPDNFNRDAIRDRFHLTSAKSDASGKKAKRARGPAPKPKFSTDVVTPKTPGHAAKIDVDISGAKKLFLVVTDAGNGFSCDWADWAEPRLIGPGGDKKLTELKWTSASTAFGQVRVGKNATGGPLRIAGESVEFGIGTHANSLIAFDLPAGYTRFTARGGLDNGGTDQAACGDGSSVKFQVFTQRPQFKLLAKNNNEPASHAADDAVEQLEVHDELDVSLFAAEPIMLNPSNIDIDHLGRVWVCEVVNYRLFQNKRERKEGDRILILEDTDYDGKADKASTFYQGRDIDSVHGICVLATPSGKGTRAIVSAKDSVFYLIDDDGDLKADRKELLFTGIAGTEHDHGIHAFVFGPDGKLYFNFGNQGKQICDRDGKPIVDLAGNEVNDHRKPYQQGMVFRCNLDGSDFETLGWNFRNNWEVTVDSFGTLWQSDNDDDGNRGTRINFVMEFGNYGYVDEFSGAAWKADRPGMHTEIPLRHWHLNDPGVVPNLLQTGAGSPTGICVYEGTLLPKAFQGELLHTDAGPNVCRAYPAKPDGAGYSAESVNVLVGADNKWFRPSDVCVAPDGSVLVADWYDSGVGGHRMEDIEHGRLFRVTPRGHDGKYVAPKQDFSSLDGMLAALNNPNLVVRTMAWTALHKQGTRAETKLQNQFELSSDARARARALWLLGKIEGRGPHYVELALSDKDANIRIVGLRLARQLKLDVIPLARRMVRDASPHVRREVAVAIRHNRSEEVPALWADLAAQYDGKDRWYLEALGIAADRQWNACLDAWLKRSGDAWSTTPAGRDIVWRSRAKRTPELLAKIVTDPKTPAETHPRYMRAFDFLSGPEKDQALKAILLGL